MTTLRSLAANSAIRRAHWRTLGLSEADMAKPKIAVVNSSSELAVCFAHLDGVARVVKEAIRAAGGIPFEVRTTAPSDFITGAACSGSYILAARDLVTNDIEAQVEAALLDGMVCLTSCDKTPPGHLMAAGRLNIPTVLVIGGYQASGMIGGEHVDIEDLFSGSVGAALGKPCAPAWRPRTPCTVWSRRSGCACPDRRRCAPTVKRCSTRRAGPERASLRWSMKA
jgi:dihydroxy-acid dehydratase